MGFGWGLIFESAAGRFTMLGATLFNIEWFVFAQTISYLFTLLIAFLIVLKQMKFIAIRFDWKIIKNIFKESFPFALIMIMMAIYYRIDGVMIERLLGNEGEKEAGIYASAYRLLDAATMLGYLFSTLLLPLFARLLAEKKPIKELTVFSFNIIFLLAITFAIPCYLYQQKIMSLLYLEANEYSSMIFGLLMINFVFISTVYITGTLLTANNNLRILNIITASGALLNIILNFILIPEYKALGAAVATLITQALVSASFLWAVHYYFRFYFRV